jgi:integrase/recombinase XerD
MDNLVGDFKNWLKNEQQLSTSTIDVYLASIRDFFEYHKNILDKSFNRLEEGDVTKYWVDLNLKDYPASTIKARISGLKKFNQFLIDKEYQDDFVVELDYPNSENQNEEDSLTTLDILNFITTVKTEGNKRDLAIVMLKMKTDIAIPEIIDLKLEDYVDGEKLIIHNPGTEEKSIFINEEVQEILSEYAKERKGYTYSNSNYFFISNKSEQLQRRQIFNLFKKYSELANLATHVTPKKLEKFKDFNWKEEIVVLRDFSFTIQNGEAVVYIDSEFITNDFNKDSFIKFIIKAKYKDLIKEFFFIVGKPEIIIKFLNNEDIFSAKGWLFTHTINQTKITKFIKESLQKETTVTSIFTKLDSLSMEEDSFKSVK